ncbi:putative RING finger domain protein [Aspergillus clavatus NRRL 1]|uniref:RING finger domain protein n=1 Tax=Aspergillus clavatus (strain ATCC 1007 / CBS 513.65 / DSM 816 / NCTC 3887 / NRRL 1 / QM 1276 / 107) TaxID=344612 RepID=A1CBT4_ASPCL|nr:uncharacterized protein ACLA_016480 [Aspergillus clavatus NRRL 1]EAW13202.1 conserved hypothetical protein [Aspergillus clavatus NRRL 1]
MPESSASRSQPHWHQSAEPSSSRDPNRPQLPPMRYPGDGYDFRRPIMSDSPQTEDVIDLTNEPDSPEDRRRTQNADPATSSRQGRLPRFGRNIISDVIDLEDDAQEDHSTDTPSSPEVQFVGATVRPSEPERAPPPPPRNQSFIGANLWELLRLQRRRMPPHGLLSREESFRQEIAWRAREMGRRPPHEMDTFWIGEEPNGAIDLTINLDGDRPFTVEYPRSGPTSERARQDSYKPPSPAPEGFTRTAGEDDVVVCPNCDEELGTGDERKQQIWVSKPCGHVYCGECARNRAVSKAKKSSQKTKPFSKCQVIDCGKPVSSPRSMVQIYL